MQQNVLPELHAMSSHLIQCQLLVQLLKPKYFFILPQLEVALLPKQLKVHTKVMNVLTVVHVMVKVVYVHVTKVTPANPAKHKPFWFKFAKKTSLNSEQKENVFHICGTIYIYKVDLKK